MIEEEEEEPEDETKKEPDDPRSSFLVEVNSIKDSLSELVSRKNCFVKPVNLLGGGVSQSTLFKGLS